MEWNQGDLVWFDPGGLGHPLPGEIQEVHQAAQIIVVQAVINGKPQTFTLAPGEGNLQLRQDLGVNGVDDMTQLDDLHEASLLWNLKLRYDRGTIYTFAGSILVAVNPYKMFPDSYGLEVAKKYAGKPLGTLPPHLFAIGAAAHAALPTPQVVVISGESGSGKTESTKLVMQYLAAVVPGGGSASAVITEQILEAAPLLEAFGNARTLRNDNSSRFGKYLEVYFKHGAIIGAKMTQYLLEKSRIVTQAAGERNYHVFYELLGEMSAAERNKYGLLEAEKYFYLNQGGTDCGPGRLDWVSLQRAMQVLGVTDQERESIVKTLAAVLHLGNIYFHRRQLRHGQEGVEVGSDAEIKWAAHLLQISSEELFNCLTTRVTETRSERMQTPLSIDQALDARDAFAKTLYSGLFNWLVSRINSIIHKGGTHDAHRISILDIFGFEDLAENSFEQLCINFANENLQLYFNKHVFKLEQAEYVRERLEWTPMSWEDNLPVIHLLAKKPVGIFHLLDDESNFPRAHDLSFLEKCHYNHALNELYSRPRIGAQEFGVTHYAGQVWYCVEGFLEKNRDAVRYDLLDLLSTSKQSLVLDMARMIIAQRDSGRSLPKGTNGRFVTMKPRTPTVSARFSDSLQQLLQSMSKCNPWFVRCIKPNNDKQALRLDMPCVLQQLRYLGMLDTIKIRKVGYPVRLRFQHFVDRYRHMLKASIPRGTQYRDICRLILSDICNGETEMPDFQLGATRVFLRECVHRQLEEGRSDRLRLAACVIQRNVRGMLTRKHLERKRRAAVKIQTAWRGHHHRNHFKRLKKATVTAQALHRGRVQRKRFDKMKNELVRRKEMEKQQRERMAQRRSKEYTERNPVLHLDVPAELAFIFSKIDGWNTVHGDRHIVKVVGTVPGPPQGKELPDDLEQFAFGKFSSVYCNGMKLQARREPIQSPFLSRAASRDQDFQDALAMFKLLLRWTGESPLEGIKDKIMADYIVHKGLTSRGLRDEILVQVCNQTVNSQEQKTNRMWQLMSHCLSCFQPGVALNKYLIKFISDNTDGLQRELLLKKLLRNGSSQQAPACRLFPPSWLEWRAASKLCDMAIGLTLADGVTQTVAIDSWTTCEEAAGLAVSTVGIPSYGWTVVMDDNGLSTDSCGLDFVLDLVSEKELCPAFPSVRSELLRARSTHTVTTEVDLHNPRRPQVPPPAPPTQRKKSVENMSMPMPQQSGHGEVQRKMSHNLLSRSSALNDRYFESEKTRSRSLDNLLGGGIEGDLVPDPIPEPLSSLGLSESRLNNRYLSNDRLTQQEAANKEPAVTRYQKFAGKKSTSSHSSKYVEREYAVRSSAMSDTSEAPSLASHVRRVRVPSQASDVDQFLDELFSPVLDGSLDELSDARSLAASIRGGGAPDNLDDILDFIDIPPLGEDLQTLENVDEMVELIKGGGAKEEITNADTTKEANAANLSVDDYITDLFQPIFINDSICHLTEKSELVEAIKGGGTTHTSHPATSPNSFTSTYQGSLSPAQAMTMSQENLLSMMSLPATSGETGGYQQHIQRTFLQSAMAQNLQIQQQLLAQNQALQTLLTQQEHGSPTSPVNTSTTITTTSVRKLSMNGRSPVSHMEMSSGGGGSKGMRKNSNESQRSHIPPPPPPPMPPPMIMDPSGSRPFLDPYGRAKTVRIGKWRWPPAKDGQQPQLTEEDYMNFKMRQNQRKQSPQANNMSPGGGMSMEWDEFEVAQQIAKQMKAEELEAAENHHHHSSASPREAVVTKQTRRSFDIGAERPPPGSVGKLKLSSEMRLRLEQVTSGHSVRSSTSNKSDRPERTPMKLEDTRRMMLEQQLGGMFANNDQSPQEERGGKGADSEKRSQWPTVLPPAPPGPAPPPPIRPPNSIPPVPPPPAPIIPGGNKSAANNRDSGVPAFMERQDRDTFGARKSWNAANGQQQQNENYNEYDRNYVMQDDREIVRSRSRSRDRENFSEAAWDRAEVEGPLSSSSAEKEHQQQQQQSKSKVTKEYYSAHQSENVRSSPAERKSSSPGEAAERSTFKTHMAQKSATERDRRQSDSPPANDKVDAQHDHWPTPVIPSPVLIPQSLKTPSTACLMYNRVPWKLRVRKEVFRPKEPIGPPAAIDLLFIQIANDVFGVTPTLRISAQERRTALSLLEGYEIAPDSLTAGSTRAIVKRHLIDMARGWTFYFSRLFVVSGSPQLPDITLMAVSHSGVYLARRSNDQLVPIKSIPFGELRGAITLPRPAAIQLNMANGSRLTLYGPRATAMQQMIETFCNEFQVQSKASTVSSGTRASAILSSNAQQSAREQQQQQQQMHSRNSMIHEQEKSSRVRRRSVSPNGGGTENNGHDGELYYQQQQQQNGNYHHQSMTSVTSENHHNQHNHNNHHHQSRNSINHQDVVMSHESPYSKDVADMHGEENGMGHQMNGGTSSKYSLLQFAAQHFRNDSASDESKTSKSNEKRLSTGSRPNIELVKWQQGSLKTPLLRLPADLAALALECFDCILRYCGDLMVETDLTEVKCVYTILMHCHKHLALRDEVYCQLMKQTTSNRSPNQESVQRAWRLMSILAAYFSCSDALRPYLMEHLSTAASDRRRACHGTAAVCLTNLRKTARCGGRKNVPSVEEVTAVSAGRSARRQIYRLPGGAERVVNTRCSTVVADVIAELCTLLGIESEEEQAEFSLYCIVQGDAFTMPLASDEYILDVTTELLKSGQPFYLIFCRSVWHFPLKREPMPAPLYIEVLFNQVAPDYLEGLLLELAHGNSLSPEMVRDMARIAALLHRAADLNHVPAMKEIKFLLPKPALGVRDIKPSQWVSFVQSAWPTVAGLSPNHVKAQFLMVLSSWPLFGSSFFAVKRIWSEESIEEPNPLWRELILALNRKGVLFLDPNTHETVQNWSFPEVISTRKVRSEDGALFLDMKVGNLMQQRVIRVQTEQAHEISRLVRQYITMAQTPPDRRD